MALPAKRKTPNGEPPKAKSKMGMVSADKGTGPAKNKLNRPIAGLRTDQMTGGEEPEVAKKQPKKGKPKRKAPKGSY